MRTTLLVLVALTLSGCSGVFPGSRPYQPLDWEAAALAGSLKTAMPSDVVTDPAQYQGRLIHWVGVVDTFSVEAVGDSVFTRIEFEQHYYDYIEDFSIQDETMFVSPLGGGRFVYADARAGASVDSLRQSLSMGAASGNLGFVYGTLQAVRSGLPILTNGRIRFVPDRLFSTAIFRYDVRRDAEGRAVGTENGFPELTGIEFLKIAGPGQND
ncbi:MAG TPA: hypothetical protein VF594_02545 [Rubricoccaceae bacterium]|jgi:hypothetical protein